MYVAFSRLSLPLWSKGLAINSMALWLSATGVTEYNRVCLYYSGIALGTSIIADVREGIVTLVGFSYYPLLRIRMEDLWHNRF